MMISALKKRIQRLRDDQDASSVMELMMVTPLILVLSGFTMDLGMLMTRNVMLERAVDVGTRDIRLGLMDNTDYDGLRRRICQEAVIIPECETRLKMQLNAMSPYSWENPGKVPDCEDLRQVTVTEPREFDAASRNQLVFFRACAVLEPVMPGWGLGDNLLQSSDGKKNRFYQVVATTTFTKE